MNANVPRYENLARKKNLLLGTNFLHDKTLKHWNTSNSFFPVPALAKFHNVFCTKRK